ncbi:MAG: hypothetical protein Q9164_006123 [Protoblastenia rupestris]
MALRTPYPSTEPKRLEGKINLANQQHTTSDVFSRQLFDETLKDIAKHWTGNWCLPRLIGDPDILEQKVSANAIVAPPAFASWSTEQPTKIPSGGNSQDALSAINNRLVCNENAHTVNIQIISPPSTYRIPPRSCFLLSKITESSVMSFSMAALQVFPAPSITSSAESGQFDLIILDPPWQNRSARRAKHYQTMHSDENPMDALRSMMGQHIALGGLVACWITNKLAVRELALKTFADWGVKLLEEWTWLKVMIDGRPVTDIEGAWRKPYEFLLIGRKSTSNEYPRSESSYIAGDIKQRVIVASPDFHSRKPNLKELIEPILPDRSSYRALEIFARNLTAGWWAWGDEVLKYNDTLAWSGNGKSNGCELHMTPS